MNPIVQMKNIVKTFGTVKALNNVNFEIMPNEIVGLVGENGAGKTTLMKILVGIYKPDNGQIYLDLKKIPLGDPQYANRHGIYMVFQEQSLLINMTVYENLFLGFEHLFQSKGLIQKNQMIQKASDLLRQMNLEVDPTLQLNKLSFVQRQMVEILRNLWKANICGTRNPIVILDEPTSALGENDSLILFEQMELLKKQASIVFISHKLNEIVKMSDRVYVLKDGKNAGLFSKNEFDEDTLRKSMLGGVIEGEYYLVDQQRVPGDNVILDVRNLTKKGFFENISFQIHEGEIFSITGTIGSGKEAICDALYGLTSYDSGEVILNTSKIRITSPVEARKHGMGLSPDDRKSKGLITSMTITDNLTISIIKGLISPHNLANIARQIIERLKILTPSEKTPVRNLSGGNQQKVVIGRLLLSRNKIVIMAFPTRGVDVGAKREIYALMREMVNKNTTIILMGDSFEEDIGLANNIMTLKDGKCTGILNADNEKPNLEVLANYIL